MLNLHEESGLMYLYNMIISAQEYIPVYLYDNKLNKTAIMKSCITDFNVLNIHHNDIDTLLESLGNFLQGSIVYSNITWKTNHRRKDNAILDSINLLVLDIDSGLTIQEVLEFDFKALLLTTTSHTDEHHKFRVLIPCAKNISFENHEDFKLFMSTVDEKYFDSCADKTCLEAGRAYISTNSAMIYRTNSTKIIDVDFVLEEVRLKKFKQNIQKVFIEPVVSFGKKSYSIKDIKKFPKVKKLVESFEKGNHYTPVYKILGIAKKSGLTSQEAAMLIMTYNIGGEYSDFNSLVKKANNYD